MSGMMRGARGEERSGRRRRFGLGASGLLVLAAAAGCAAEQAAPGAATEPEEVARFAVVGPLRVGASDGALAADPGLAALRRVVEAIRADERIAFVLFSGEVVGAESPARAQLALAAAREALQPLDVPLYGVTGPAEERAGIAADLLRMLASPRRDPRALPPREWTRARAWPPPDSGPAASRSWVAAPCPDVVLLGVDSVSNDGGASPVPEPERRWLISAVPREEAVFPIVLCWSLDRELMVGLRREPGVPDTLVALGRAGGTVGTVLVRIREPDRPQSHAVSGASLSSPYVTARAGDMLPRGFPPSAPPPEPPLRVVSLIPGRFPRVAWPLAVQRAQPRERGIAAGGTR